MTATTPVGNRDRIMVVDDEESILAMTRAALENHGYMVSTAATGMEAITRFRENSDAFSIVITDQFMPLLFSSAATQMRHYDGAQFVERWTDRFRFPQIARDCEVAGMHQIVFGRIAYHSQRRCPHKK